MMDINEDIPKKIERKQFPNQYNKYLGNMCFKFRDMTIFSFNKEEKIYYFQYVFNAFNWKTYETSTIFINAKTFSEVESTLEMMNASAN